MSEPLSEAEDAFGRLLLDYLEGVAGQLILELDDGRAGPALPADVFFADHGDWPAEERQVFEFVRGRVDDVRELRSRRDGSGRRARPPNPSRYDDAERARIVLDSVDPHEDTDPAELAYQERNRAGELPGHVTIRLRYGGHATPWFELLNLSARELEDLVAEAGWQLAHLAEGEPPEHYAVLEKYGRHE